MATVKQIVADARQARKHLGELETQIQDELDEIRLRAFLDGDRQLTASEVAIRDARRAQKAEAQDAFIASTFVTLKALNNSEDVKRLSLRMQAVNDGLDDDLKRLKRIRKYAATAASVAETLARLAARLVQLAA